MIKKLFDILFQNKDWLFSGIGAISLFSILSLFFRRRNQSKKQTDWKIKKTNVTIRSNSLVTLPNGESINPNGIDAIEISHTKPYKIFIRRGNSTRFCFQTHSRKSAENWARSAAKAINAALT